MKKIFFIAFMLLINNFFAQTCNDYTISPSSAILDDNNFYYWTVNVPDFGIIQDIDVTINITHTWNSDLDIVLESPSGTQVELSTDNGSNGDNYDNVVLDDSAQDIITNAGSSGISGNWRPEEALIKVRGEEMHGDWKLFIRDDTNNDTGTLNSVTFRICKMGYTGPGGVGDSETNVLWLRSEDISLANNADISSWTDVSGHSNTVSQSSSLYQPIFRDNQVNSYPLVEFSSDKNRIIKNSFTNFPSTEITEIYVNKNSETDDGILSYASSEDDNDFLLFGSEALDAEIEGNKVTSTIAYNNNTWNIANVSWRSSDGLYEIWKNCSYKASLSNFQTGNKITNGGCLAIGCDQDSVNGGYSSGDTHTGDFTEIIIYNTFLTRVQHKIVSNYLSAKYETTLEADDLYTQDNLANGNFDFNVAGIGQTGVDSSNHTDSQGTGIIRINTPSDLADSRFLFWGEDVKNATYTFTASTQYTERLDTKWRVSKFNDLGTVSVHVKQSDIDVSGMTACASLKLLVDNTSNFSSPTKKIYNMVLTGGIYTATNVNFTDGDYFTLEFFDKIVVDGTTFYNGSGVNHVPDTTDGCYKLLVKNTADGSLALTENAHVSEVEVEVGGKLVVNNDVNFEINNTIINNGDIRLLGNAQLLQTHTGISQVTGTGKLYMDKKSKLTNIYQSSYWSSPVSTDGSTFSIVDIMKDGSTPTTKDTNPSNINFIAGYDGADTTPISISKFWLSKFVNSVTWNRHGDETASYNITESYNMKSTGGNQPNYTFVGVVNDGDYTSAITQGNSSLLGNPYPSAMNADTFLSDNSSIFDTLYYWDSKDDSSLSTHVRGDYDGGYATYKSGTGTKFNTGDVPNNIIPVGQGFFVDATLLSSGSTSNILFNNGQRIASTSGSFYSRSSATIPLIRLGLSFAYDDDKSFHRQLAVSFRDASNNYDVRYDAYLSDMRPTDMSVKALDTTVDYVIKALANYSDDLEIPLHIKLDQQRDLIFMIDGIENLTINQIFLKDLETNLYYNLETPISLNIEAGDYTDRFVIVFRNSVAETKDLTKETTITIIDGMDIINIQSNQIIKEVHIFNTLGQLVTQRKGNTRQIEIAIQDKTGQVLFVKTTLESGQIQTEKIIKK